LGGAGVVLGSVLDDEVVLFVLVVVVLLLLLLGFTQLPRPPRPIRIYPPSFPCWWGSTWGSVRE
jgi:hypothetical protein